MVALLTVGCSSKDSDDNQSTTTDTTVADVTQTPTAEPTAEPTEAPTAEPMTEDTEPVEVLVAAAASLQNAMTEIQTLYQTENPNVTLTFTFGSSGTLQQQIEQGAPVDVFMSAATKQMTALEGESLIMDGTKKELLENKVVLIVPKNSTLGLTSFEDILKAPLIALGDPASVPAGQYAEEALTSLGILDQVKEKVLMVKMLQKF